MQCYLALKSISSKLHISFKHAEKQLAATKTELASSSTASAIGRLLPILGVLLAIVMLLVMVTVIVVLALRSRHSRASPQRHNSSELSSHVSFSKGPEEEIEQQVMMNKVGQHGSPDVVPQGENGKLMQRVFRF